MGILATTDTLLEQFVTLGGLQAFRGAARLCLDNSMLRVLFFHGELP